MIGYRRGRRCNSGPVTLRRREPRPCVVIVGQARLYVELRRERWARPLQRRGQVLLEDGKAGLYRRIENVLWDNDGVVEFDMEPMTPDTGKNRLSAGDRDH